MVVSSLPRQDLPAALIGIIALRAVSCKGFRRRAVSSCRARSCAETSAGRRVCHAFSVPFCLYRVLTSALSRDTLVSMGDRYASRRFFWAVWLTCHPFSFTSIGYRYRSLPLSRMLNAISYGIDADRRCLPDLFPFRLWIAAGGCSFVRGSYRVSCCR